MSTDHLDNENFIDLEKSCPLCMELFDLDDMGFLPCPCGYRICRFCWHRLKTYEDNIEAGSEEIDGSATSGRCPACRKVYSDVPVGFNTDLTLGSMLDQNKYKKKKKRLQNKQKQKLLEEKQKLKEILKREEKSLAGLRVVQKNLVFVIGIPQRNNEELRREFSKFGKIHKLVIGNTNNSNTNTAYVTYTRPEDAIKTIQALNQGTTSLNSQLIISGQSKLHKNTTRSTTGVIKASLGTTKYCNNWLKDQQCPKLPDCMYLHELADQEASFTKEDMQKGKHADYEKKLIQQYLDKRKNSISDCMSDNLKISNNSESSNSSNVSINNLCLSKNENDVNINYDDNESLIYMDRKHLENCNIKNEENDNEDNSHFNHFNHFSLQENENSIKTLVDNNKKKDSCDKSPIFESQKLLKVEDSQNSITGNKTLNVSSLKSSFINIDNTKNNKLRMNLIDEIIANSSDSSTSYSTCSSGSNRLNRLTNDINQLNENIINVEHLNSSNVLDKKISNHSPVLNAINNNFDDDDLDFDPISISTIGLQDLLKTTNIDTPLNPTSSSVPQINQGSVNPMFAQTSHPQSILNLNSSLTNPNFNNGLHNQNANKQQINDRPNIFTSSFSNMNKNFQQPASNDLTDTWRNSLRALLPNVNITFANNSSSNQNNFIKQQQLNQQVKQQQTLANFTQQNSIKCNPNFVNQLQQQQSQNHQLQQQPVYPIAFLQQQQLLRQQLAPNPYLFSQQQQQQQQQHKNSVQQLKPSVQLTNINQSNQTGPLQQQHLNNLQRYFSQNFHQEAHQQQPPPGFANF